MKAVALMFAVEQPDADCGHGALVRQQCGRCLQWCCAECYSPWMALACNACRAEAAVRPVAPIRMSDGLEVEPPVSEIEVLHTEREPRRCRDRRRAPEAVCRRGISPPFGR